MGHFVLFLLCAVTLQFTDAYDPVDPNGNITITWDFQVIDITYTVLVSIHNYQLYRHIEQPGWRLSWKWAGDEVIWNMWGAEATEQGNCSRFRGGNIPHCCEKRPVIADLLPGTPYNMQVANCCRAGVLSSLTQDKDTSVASFQMVVGNANGSDVERAAKPTDFSIGMPGYTCSDVTEVPPTKTRFDKQRHLQMLMTWQITCSYSQFRESATPTCCVSLSTFYNDTIVECPHCSCRCQMGAALQCVSESEQSKLLQPPDTDGKPAAPAVRCTGHMCPIRVHWHVKLNYREYWRVKVTVTNFNLHQNYSDWNLVMQHPNLRGLTQLFSFNYQPLVQYGAINDTGIFWGIQYYNEMLLQDGNVQTEMILKKHRRDFTFSGGWAFPRRIYFDGRECVMPPPDQYPSLPNASSDLHVSVMRQLSISSCLLVLFVFL